MRKTRQGLNIISYCRTLEIADNIGGLIDFSKGSFGKTICPFGEAVAWPVRSFVEKFKGEFMEYLPQEKVVA